MSQAGYAGIVVVGIIALVLLLFGVQIIQELVDLSWLLILLMFLVFGSIIAFSHMRNVVSEDRIHHDIKNIEKQLEFK